MTPEQAKSLKVGDMVFETIDGGGCPGMVINVDASGENVSVRLIGPVVSSVIFGIEAIERYVQPSDRLRIDEGRRQMGGPFRPVTPAATTSPVDDLGRIQADSRARGEANAELFAELDKAKAAQRATEFELRKAKDHWRDIVRALDDAGRALRADVFEDKTGKADLTDWLLLPSGRWICDLDSEQAAAIAKMIMIIEREAAK